MTCERLEFERNSIFKAALIYKDPNNVPVDLTGISDDADFTIHDGQGTELWVGSVTNNYLTADWVNGRFDLLIPESVIDTLDFDRAKFRFRIKWVVEGWQSIGDGDVVFSD